MHSTSFSGVERNGQKLIDFSSFVNFCLAIKSYHRSEEKSRGGLLEGVRKLKYREIEKALKLCSAGAREKVTKCPKCPYLEKGCLSALLADASRYIDYLKSPRRRYDESHKAKAVPPQNRGKPVAEWLKEQREEAARTGAKDCGDIPW